MSDKELKLRDKFAAAAMMALAYNGRMKGSVGVDRKTTAEDYRPFTHEVWLLADAMLLERTSNNELNT